MTYDQFKISAKDFTLAELRCDVPPTDEVYELMDEAGQHYERFVLRWERDCDRNLFKGESK